MIQVFENIVSKDLCDKYIYFYKYAKWLRQDAKVTSTNGNHSEINNVRKSEYIRLLKNYFYDDVNEIYENIYQLAINSFDFDLYKCEDMFEDVKIIKYKKGDYFNWHYDCFHQMTKTRKINFTVQLNQNYEGGDLEFFEMSTPQNKTTGTVILYPAFLPHRIIPVTKGIRYSIVGHLNGPKFR